MPEHLSAREIDAYRDRALSTQEIIVVCNHLENCAQCRELLGEAGALRSVYAGLGRGLEDEFPVETAHLSADQLADYVDEAMGDADRKLVETHVALCSRCETEIGELREIKAAMRNEVAGSDASIASKKIETQNLWAGTAIFLRAAAVILILIAGVVIVLMSGEVRRLQNELGDLRRRNEELRAASDQLSKVQAELDELKAAIAASGVNRSDLVIALADGGRVVGLDSAGNLQGVSPLDSSTASLVKNALTTGVPVTPAALKEFGWVDSAIMGESDPDSVRLQWPLATVLMTEYPTFKWRPVPGATKYRVIVTDSGFDRIAAESEQLAFTEWTPQDPLP